MASFALGAFLGTYHAPPQPEEIDSISELDSKCIELVKKHKGKTIDELLSILDLSPKTKITKSINERVVVKMFGSDEKKLNSIQQFNKAGIIGKTITITEKGTRTEDMKLFQINFDEIENSELLFDDSQFYDYFANHQFLCIIFQEDLKTKDLSSNKFVGFSRVSFDDDFIYKHVEPVWNSIRELIFTNTLKNQESLKNDGTLIINETGVIKSAPNFPKSKDNPIFVRGSGTDSSYKPLVVNNISMYSQWIWVKGSLIVSLINEDKEVRKINY